MTLTAKRTKARRSPTTTMGSTTTTTSSKATTTVTRSGGSSSSSNTEKLNPQLLANETRRLGRVKFADFIRGDNRYPDRYVFSPDLFPDYTRTTQKNLVAMIQQVCKAQHSPVSVHQWATEEHDDRVVRRIRFRCASFRKKKKGSPSGPSCGFQFQVCFQATHGWCMLNGKGQCRHSGHPVVQTKEAAASSSKFSSIKQSPKTAPLRAASRKSSSHVKLPSTPTLEPSVPTSSISYAAADQTEATPMMPDACLSIPIHPLETTEHVLSHNDENMFVPDLTFSHTMSAAAQEWDDIGKVDSKMTSLYTDIMFGNDMAGDDMMEFDLLDEAVVPETTAVSASAGGYLSKMIHLAKVPFPEVPDLDDKCVGILQALQVYATAHRFAVTVEDYTTVDRPGERTMRIVLHCLGTGCSYQAALLWVVGRTHWNIYCQPDGIFVHGCQRLDEQTPCAPMASTTPLNQAMEHFVDFLNGEVVCPDDTPEQNPDFCSCCWKSAEEKPTVSEKVLKETHKAVDKVAGVEGGASAA